MIVVVGRLFIVFESTRFVGVIIQGRILNTYSNWRTYPGRSAYEAILFVGTLWAALAMKLHLSTAVQLAAAIGCTSALAHEYFMYEMLREISRRNEAVRAEKSPERSITGGRKSAAAAKAVEAAAAAAAAAAQAVEEEAAAAAAAAAAQAVEEEAAAVTTAHDPESKTVSWEELQKHDRPEDAWIAVHGKVYDATQWIPLHPGGDVINSYAGKVRQRLFLSVHCNAL